MRHFFVQKLSVLFLSLLAFQIPLEAAICRFPTSLLPRNNQEQGTLAVVIDAASSGRFLGPAFKAKNIEIAHIQSAQVLPKWAERGLDLNPFPKKNRIVHGEDLAATANALQKLAGRKKLIIIPGAETGVELSEQLNAYLKLTNANDAGDWMIRKDKFLMNQAASTAGLRTARQQKVSEFKDAQAFADIVGYPIVVKPQNSSGGNLVTIAENPAELKTGIERIVRVKNGDLRISSHAVVLEYLDGKEFAVNGVASDGYYVVTDVIEYDKIRVPGRGNTYKSDFLAAPRNNNTKIAIDYGLGVLPALGFRNGPFHLEIKVDPKLGPALIELNARTCGGGLPQWTSRATEVDFFELVTLAYLDPQTFKKIPTLSYRIKQELKAFMLRTPRGGLKLKDEMVAKMNALPGVAEITWFHPPHAELPETVDYDSSAARIIIMSHYPAIVESTFSTLERWLETEYFFK
jgi:biotin carboxylase